MYSFRSCLARLVVVWLLGTLGFAHAASWRTSGSTQLARGYHTATLLADGRVLAVGGDFAAAEIYNPLRRSWTAAGNLPEVRGLHTATLLRDGRVLVVGGAQMLTWDPNFVPLSSARLFDPISSSWTPVAALLEGRANHTATLLPDSRVLVAGGYTGDGNATPETAWRLASAEIYDPANNTWAPAGALGTARALHTATLTADGSVMVVGGARFFGGTGPDPGRFGTEFYQPVSDTWSAGASLADSRYLHTATQLPDGRVLVYGGVVDNQEIPSNSSVARVYDPLDQTWSNVAAPPVDDTRYDHTAALLPDGRVLVSGGFSGGFLSSAAAFDPADDSWTALPSMVAARAAHSITLLADGTVLAVAGYTTGGNTTTSVEVFDPALPTVSPLASLGGVGRFGATASLLPEGDVLLAGGNNGSVTGSVQRWDADGNTWAATAPLATPRRGHTATLLADGSVFVAGGESGGGNVLGNTERYAPGAGTWSAAGNLSVARRLHSATLLANGRVLLVGGSDGAQPLASVESYNPLTNSLSSLSAMPVARQSHRALLLTFGGSMLVCGGLTGAGGTTVSDRCDRYLTSLNQWSAANPLPAPRSGMSMTLLGDGRVLIVGGSDATGVAQSTVWISGPGGSDDWTATAGMSGARSGHSATLLPDGRVLVAGGVNAAGAALDTAEVYDPVGAVWTTVPASIGLRHLHSAVLLRDGSVMLVGGADALATPSADVARVDPQRTPLPSRSPMLDSAARLASPANALAAAGQGFRPRLEGAGGGTINAAANHPVFQVQRVDNGEMLFLRWDASNPPTDGIFQSPVSGAGSLAGFPVGPLLVRVWVNGVPSAARVVLEPANYTVVAVPAANGSISPTGPQAVDAGQTLSFTVTPDSGYRIDEIVSECPSSTPLDIGNGSFTVAVGPVLQDCEVAPAFVVDAWTVTAAASPASGGSAVLLNFGINLDQVPTGTVLEFGIEPAPGWDIADPALHPPLGSCIDVGSSSIGSGALVTHPIEADCNLVARFANQAPTFTAGIAPTAIVDSGEQTLTGWMQDIRSGSGIDPAQSLSVEITPISGGSLLLAAPTIDAVGTLRFTPGSTAGEARYSVRLRDDAGTLYGGSDTSAPYELVIGLFESGANVGLTVTPGDVIASSGQTLAFTLTLSNAGPSDASGSRVDWLPNGMSGVSWSCSGAAGGACTTSGTGGIDQTVTLPVGASVSWNISGTFSPGPASTLTNSASVSLPVGLGDPAIDDNIAIWQIRTEALFANGFE